jgi:hypothetical protein
LLAPASNQQNTQPETLVGLMRITLEDKLPGHTGQNRLIQVKTRSPNNR